MQNHATNPAEYAVGWFTLALINSGLAQSKGRSGLNWWIASLFIGPIATLMIVTLDPQPSPKKFNLQDHRIQ
jgi:hypothetical protein